MALDLGWLKVAGQRLGRTIRQLVRSEFRLRDWLFDRGVNEAKWRLAVEKYYTSPYERVGFVRVLGKLDSEPIEEIFTQINVLDRPTAELRYRLDETREMWRDRRMWYDDRIKRMDALAALAAYPKLFILGKPGAGKTTFLKYAAVQAIQREIELFPIFVTLKEMSDDNGDLRSGDDVLDFIVKRAVFRIPEPRDFVTRLLERGKALLLFDGLDEVNLAGDRRSNMINALNQFAQQFNESKYALTCRVAATDYSFTQFEYVEMADFDDGQIAAFVDKWFVGDEGKRDACKRELTGDDANKMLRELAQVPLLLTLLCLVYEERNEFPPNRAEIYEEATRALLSKWDAGRNIRRDTDHSPYEKLTLKGKQDLLAYLAARTFEDGEYLVPRRKLAQLIEAYLDGAPGIDDADGEIIVREIAAQHGLLVERTRDIWSFSHLTLQEYFCGQLHRGQ
ncbi:MAG: NACHT domain-containing protein [Anaerolineae bacterium]|nr:NACHT domain-containing protein [Anaerolineae bacterium]